MEKQFEVVINEIEGEEPSIVVKVLHKGVAIFVDVAPKTDETMQVIEQWRKFVETCDGALSTIVVDPQTNEPYATVLFLKILKDTAKYRIYEYRLNVYDSGWIVFDKEQGKFLLLLESPKDLSDEEISKIVNEQKVMEIFTLHVYK